MGTSWLNTVKYISFFVTHKLYLGRNIKNKKLYDWKSWNPKLMTQTFWQVFFQKGDICGKLA